MMNPFSVAPARKVAGYARVSTDEDEQTSSYEAQLNYYTNMINSHDGWVFAGMYSDEGITGTSMKKRIGFQNMIADALNGKIDLIVTKSVSRFARNTVDSISTIRDLKAHNIEVYFEKENIWTLDSKGELLITIMSSLAQEESRSISENVTWGHRRRMENGKVSLAYSTFLGYDKGENGELVINEEEAKIIRLIFSDFLSGLSYNTIAKKLTEKGIKTPSGRDVWNSTTVKNILKNEKYKGDALLQKNYVADYLTKKRVKNHGEVPQYYVENDHEPIIPPEIFDRVQDLIAEKKTSNRVSGQTIFSSKIKCGECGEWYGPKTWHSNSKYRKAVWQCNRKHSTGKHKSTHCKTPYMTDEKIQNAFISAVNKMITNKSDVLNKLEEISKTLADTEGVKEDLQIKEIQKEKAWNKIHALIAENKQKPQNQSEWQKRFDEQNKVYEDLKIDCDFLQAKIARAESRKRELALFIRQVRNLPDLVTKFDELLWGSLVNYVTIYKEGQIIFTMYGGLEIEA